MMHEPSALVVDDEPNVVRLCKRLLEKNGFQVMGTTSASEALDIISRQTINLLLVDIRMPGLDGFQLHRLARRHQPDIATVIITGYGPLETAMRALQEGADALVLKPFSNNLLVETAQNALRERQNKRDISRLRALQPLLKITDALFSERNPQKLREDLVEVISQTLPCKHALLYHRRLEETNFTQCVYRGEVVLPAESPLVAHWLEIASKFTGAFWLKRDRSHYPELAQVLEPYSIADILVMQFAVKDEQYIVVAAQHFQGQPFREADLELFTILVTQASLALENASLYEALRQSIQQMEQTRSIMIQAEKMAAAGRLTASIAHEINNPLQSLDNCLHLAGRSELSPAERQKYLDMAQNELDRLMSTVQRMLDFYRPGIRDRSLISVNEVVRRVVMLMDPQFRQGKVNVETWLDPDTPNVIGVASQLQQVLINLFLNALEAMPQGGAVRVRTCRITELDALDDGIRSGVEILVEDTGPGINQDVRAQIFEPFMSTKEHGTGLGLAVSYGIVAAHGGSLRLVERSGPGACFRIALPNGENPNESQDSANRR